MLLFAVPPLASRPVWKPPYQNLTRSINLSELELETIRAKGLSRCSTLMSKLTSKEQKPITMV